MVVSHAEEESKLNFEREVHCVASRDYNMCIENLTVATFQNT